MLLTPSLLAESLKARKHTLHPTNALLVAAGHTERTCVTAVLTCFIDFVLLKQHKMLLPHQLIVFLPGEHLQREMQGCC